MNFVIIRNATCSQEIELLSCFNTLLQQCELEDSNLVKGAIAFTFASDGKLSGGFKQVSPGCRSRENVT